MGFFGTLGWLLRGDVYAVAVSVRHLSSGNLASHLVYVRAHDALGARIKGYRQTSRRFPDCALEVTASRSL